MATIGTLSVSITAKSKRFVSGLTKARKAVNGFVSKIPGANILLSKFGAIMSGAALVGIGVMVKKQMAAIDAISKLSDELEISTETLVGWGHAADITGTSSEAVHKSIRRMIRTIGEANQGMSSGVLVFKELGLNAKEFADLSPEQSFYKIVEQINGMNSAADKAAYAYKIFGKSGQQMLNLIAQGEDGIKALVKDADELGLAFSRVEGAQVEQANDALGRMGKIFTGIWRKLAIELAPMIEHVAKRFVAWGKSSGGMGSVVVGVVKNILKAVGFMIDAWNVAAGIVKVFVGVVVAGMGYIGKAIAYAGKAFDTFISVITLGIADSDVGGTLERLADSFIETGDRMMDEGAKQFAAGWAGEGADEWLDAIEDIQRESKKTAENYAETLESQRENAKEAKAAADAAREAAEAADKHAKAVERLRETSTNELERLERIAKMTDEERENADLILKIEKLRAEKLDDLADRYERLLELRKEEKKAAKDLAKFEAEVAKKKEALAKRYEDIDAKRRRMQEDARASGERVRDMEREVEVLRAATEGERKRIELRQEYEDMVKRAGDNEAERQAATVLYQEKLNELKREEAAAAEKAAEKNKESRDAVKEMAEQMKRDLDVTKKFHAAPGGGGLFGFGKGRVGQFTQFYQPGSGQRTKSPMASSEERIKKSAKAAMDKVPDITKNLDALTGKIEAMGTIYERLNTAVKHQADETVRVVRDMRSSTTETVTHLAKGQGDLRGEVSTLKQQLDYALDIGLGGE